MERQPVRGHEIDIGRRELLYDGILNELSFRLKKERRASRRERQDEEKQEKDRLVHTILTSAIDPDGKDGIHGEQYTRRVIEIQQ